MDNLHLLTEPAGALDLETIPLHLGTGSRAVAVRGFDWDSATLQAYTDAVAGDGAEGRLVTIFANGAAWTVWERHPAGDEVVICLSGRMTALQDVDGTIRAVDLSAGQAVVNPAGVWHTADVHEPGRILTITPGVGTEHRPR